MCGAVWRSKPCYRLLCDFTAISSSASEGTVESKDSDLHRIAESEPVTVGKLPHNAGGEDTLSETLPKKLIKVVSPQTFARAVVEAVTASG